MRSVYGELTVSTPHSGQDRQYNDFLKPRKPVGSFNPREYFFDTSAPAASIIRDPLYEVIQMRVSSTLILFHSSLYPHVYISK